MAGVCLGPLGCDLSANDLLVLEKVERVAEAVRVIDSEILSAGYAGRAFLATFALIRPTLSEQGTERKAGFSFAR